VTTFLALAGRGGVAATGFGEKAFDGSEQTDIMRTTPGTGERKLRFGMRLSFSRALHRM